MSDLSDLSETEARPITKRLRGPNIATVIAAAAKRGLQMTGAVVKPGGSIELKFAPGGVVGETPEDIKRLV